LNSPLLLCLSLQADEFSQSGKGKRPADDGRAPAQAKHSRISSDFDGDSVIKTTGYKADFVSVNGDHPILPPTTESATTEPMQGVMPEGEPQPTLNTEREPQPTEGTEDEPQPMEDTESKPQPMEGTEDEPQSTEGTESGPLPTEGTEDEPQPTEGTENEPQPTEGTEDEPQPTEGTKNEPQPTEGIQSEPQPTDGTESEPQPIEGAESRPHQTDGTENEPQPTEGTESEPLPIKGTEDEPHVPREATINDSVAQPIERAMDGIDTNREPPLVQSAMTTVAAEGEASAIVVAGDEPRVVQAAIKENAPMAIEESYKLAQPIEEGPLARTTTPTSTAEDAPLSTPSPSRGGLSAESIAAVAAATAAVRGTLSEGVHIGVLESNTQNPAASERGDETTVVQGHGGTSHSATNTIVGAAANVAANHAITAAEPSHTTATIYSVAVASTATAAAAPPTNDNEDHVSAASNAEER